MQILGATRDFKARLSLKCHNSKLLLLFSNRNYPSRVTLYKKYLSKRKSSQKKNYSKKYSLPKKTTLVKVFRYFKPLRLDESKFAFFSEFAGLQFYFDSMIQK